MTGPMGPVIVAPGQYTHCVDRSAYHNLPGGPDLDMSFAAYAELGCDYMLGGKLVCLAGGQDECVIGTVAGVQGVKRADIVDAFTTFDFDAIDNDFTFNVLILPFQPRDFDWYRANVADPASFDAHKISHDVLASNSPLASLMTDPITPTTLPMPREANTNPGTSPLDGYGVLYKWSDKDQTLVPRTAANPPDDENQDNLYKIWDGPNTPKDASVISIPVLHCECEGSRTLFVCQATKPFLDLMQGKVPGVPGPSPSQACHAALGWIPFGIGDAICSIVDDIVAGIIGLVLAPAFLGAFADAWDKAQAFDDQFVTGPVAKQIHVGDPVIVTGRWVWDGGHVGHTELHPVKTVQKVVLPAQLRGGYDPRTPLPASIADEIRDVRNRWCRYVREAPPPPDPRQPSGLSGSQLAGLDPDQQVVYGQQQQPENQWSLHPLIDGCTPAPEPRVG
jgi:hypothetical protein